MIFHHDSQDLGNIHKKLERQGINRFHVDEVHAYLSDSEFKIFCTQTTNINKATVIRHDR